MPWYSIPKIVAVTQASVIVCNGETTAYEVTLRGRGIFVVRANKDCSWPGAVFGVYVDKTIELNLPLNTTVSMFFVGMLGYSRAKIKTVEANRHIAKIHPATITGVAFGERNVLAIPQLLPANFIGSLNDSFSPVVCGLDDVLVSSKKISVQTTSVLCQPDLTIPKFVTTRKTFELTNQGVSCV